MNSLFQQTLKTISFKTFHHNQFETLGYDDLFSGRRVLVFSITQFRTLCSAEHSQSYIDNYTQFLNNGIDEVYVVDSTDWLIAPMMDKKSKTIRGLPDRDMSFVQAVADQCGYQKPTIELARMWQYVTIIDDGEVEKLWHNPFTTNTSLLILKDPAYRYRKLSADVILKYLVDNQT